jgi:hypothetical protein
MFLSVQPAAHYLDGFKDPFGHGGEGGGEERGSFSGCKFIAWTAWGIEPFKTFGFTTTLALISGNQKSEFEKREENPDTNPLPHLHI